MPRKSNKQHCQVTVPAEPPPPPHSEAQRRAAPLSPQGGEGRACAERSEAVRGDCCNIGSSAHLPSTTLTPVPSPKGRGESPLAPLPTLEDEIRRLAVRRDQVDAALLQRLQQDSLSTSEVLRYLAVLTQVSRDLARMLVQRAASSGNEEIERFLEDVTREARALTSGQEH